MKKALILAPIGVAAVGAVLFIVLKKPAGDKAAAPKKAAPAKPGGKAKAAAPKSLKTGGYSFISGFKDAATVEVSLQYDAANYSFDVIEEEFPAYTSDSHAAVVSGGDFTMQIEYAGYYNGEDFAVLSKSLAEKYKGFGDAAYGANKGVKFIDGDNICMAFPAGSDPYSYVLVTLIKGKEYDEDFTTLPDHPDVGDVLGSMQFSSKK